ncbi:CRISPR-associated helicase Cas3' [Vulcanibacillus modesticaldus]|nr:CRISPR-associated helicase Cas3' [Vulcanibacillus modesticaldus]
MGEALEFFKTLLGGKFYPRPFQLEPIKYLYSGQPVVLSAPTGSGKTWAGIFPFLYAKVKNKIFADKLFYVLPLRTLTRSIFSEISEKIDELNLDLKVTIQMGEQMDDPFFEGDIIITTIDQLLSNYIGASLSTSIGQSNIPPGAYLGAYFVFDEIHAVPREAMPTILDMVRRLKDYSRFLLMTATIPTTVLDEVVERIEGEKIFVSNEQIISEKWVTCTNLTRRKLYWNDQELNVDKIIDLHMKQEGKRRTIVIINRVDKAQHFYLKIKALFKQLNLKDEIFLLHSRFLPEDRKNIEQQVIKLLGKNGNKNEHVIVIATQVIEVGVDISARVLISELAPANSLIQRSGRCARFPNETGEVYIFDLPKKANGKLDTSPYFNQDRELVYKTKEYLKELKTFKMTLHKELEMVDIIHREIDLQRIRKVPSTKAKQNVNKSLVAGEYNFIPQLVRDIPNTSLIIHDHPSNLDMELIPERFSIRTSTLRRYLDSCNDFNGKVWGYSFQEEMNESQWVKITNLDDISKYPLVCIHPDIVLYHGEIGLIFRDEIDSNIVLNDQQPYVASYILDKPRGYHRQFSYHKEKYIEHIKSVREIFNQEKKRIHIGLTYFAKEFKIPTGELEKVIEMAIAFHDVGKLNEEIVTKFWNWQKIRRGEVCQEFLAHTDYDPTNVEDFLEWKKQKRIPHAIESAYITLPMVEKKLALITDDEDLSQILTKAIFTAIARHHNSYTSSLKRDGKLHQKAKSTLVKTLTKLGFKNIELQVNDSWNRGYNFSKYFIYPSEEKGWLWYWFVVRCVRLVDQYSQFINTEKEVSKWH